MRILRTLKFLVFPLPTPLMVSKCVAIKLVITEEGCGILENRNQVSLTEHTFPMGDRTGVITTVHV